MRISRRRRQCVYANPGIRRCGAQFFLNTLMHSNAMILIIIKLSVSKRTPIACCLAPMDPLNAVTRRSVLHPVSVMIMTYLADEPVCVLPADVSMGRRDCSQWARQLQYVKQGRVGCVAELLSAAQCASVRSYFLDSYFKYGGTLISAARNRTEWSWML
jgi:hypothetical protein